MLSSRMTTIALALMLTALSCAPAPERSDRADDGSLGIRATESRYTADTSGGGLSVRVNMTASNGGADTVYFSTCGANTPAHLLERLEGDAWVVAIRPACPMILTPPIAIAPGASRTDTFPFQASLAPEGTPGASFPRFEGRAVEGTYRIAYEAFARGWTIEDSGPDPSARLPEAERASAPFTIQP